MCKLERRIIEDLMVERLEKNRLIAVSGMSIEELADAFTKGYRLVSPEALNMISVSVIKDIKSDIEHEGDMYPDGDWYISIDRVREIFDKHTTERRINNVK